MSPLKQPPSKKFTDVVSIDPDPDPPPTKSASSPPDFLWSSLFTESPSSNAPSSSPSYLQDGTPVVIAPPSVILHASSSWAGHLICRFMGEPPSPAKFFSDLNRIWGKYGDISVRRFTSGAFLVHVPSTSTRRWILQTGLWSSGTVSFVVSEWSVTSTLASPPKLTSASTLLTIRDIPPQLWSQEAVTMIAGGVAKLIPGMRASLPFSSLGTATIRAIVPLGSPLPSSVMVKDAHGSSVLVSIDYGRLPHLCSICSSYGHQSHRCLQRKSATNPIPPKLNSKSLRKAEPASIPETAQISISQDAVIVVGQSSSSIVPLINDPASPEHKMELDTVVSEQVILDAATENPSVPASTKSSKMSTVLDSHKVSMVNAMDSSSQNLLQEKSPTLVAEVPNQSMDLDTTAAPESEDQTMELDSKPCKDLVLKVSSTSHHVFTSSPSLPDDAQQVIQSSSKDGPSSLQPSLCLSSQSQTLLELSSNGDSDPHPVPVPSANLSEAHQHDHSSSQSTNKDHTAITFSFPPPVIHEMEVKNDHIQSLLSPDISALDHHSKVKIEDKSKEVGSRNKTQVKLASALLKCKKEISQFKPKGIVEKRRKKMQNGMVLEADELQQGLQEMESDKKNTTYYEAILAHKISGNPDIVTEETLET